MMNQKDEDALSLIRKDARGLVEQLEEELPDSDTKQKENIYDEILGRSYVPRSESIEKGKALRRKYPRSKQGEWKVQMHRQKAVEIILNQEEGRIAELIPVRHKRMTASPFAFYRASAAVMASDLSEIPNTGITVQACGDAHLSNFGMFRSPERNLVFDINDFDETLPGPWEWDLMRLLTSVEICGREHGFSSSEREKAVWNGAETYRRSMQKFSDYGNLEVWYEHLDINRLYEHNRKSLGEEYAAAIHEAVKKASAKNNEKAVAKLTESVNGRLQFVSKPPLIVPLREMKSVRSDDIVDWLRRSRTEYRLSLPRERRFLLDQYQVIDIARKVVGVGSVGTRDWIALLQGRENDDYLVLQIKEAGRSVLEDYVGRSVFLEHGRRVVEGQRAIQTSGDIMLGWSRMIDEKGNPGDYYVRQLWDGKGSFDLTAVTPEILTGITGLSAWVLAHAHAKTGNRHMIAGYLGKEGNFDNAMLAFAKNYADQNEEDYQTFCDYMKNH